MNVGIVFVMSGFPCLLFMVCEFWFVFCGLCFVVCGFVAYGLRFVVRFFLSVVCGLGAVACGLLFLVSGFWLFVLFL